MAEIRRGLEAVQGGERLPWLEPVEDEDGDDFFYDDRRNYAGLIVILFGAVAALAIIAGAVFWYRHMAGGASDVGQILRAPSTPYKVRPANPGGMQTDANGEVVYRTSAGQDIDSPIDLAAMPEQPVAGPGSSQPAPAAAQPAPAAPAPGAPVPAASTSKAMVPAAQTPPAAALARPAVPPRPVQAAAAVPQPAKPAPVAAAPVTIPAEADHGGGPGGSIQLGAFSTEGGAKSAWKSLSGRFSFLQDLTMVVMPVKAGDKTLYRLRASGGSPGPLCAKLKVAGESCAVIGG